jgi:hypothetical protein
MKDGFANGHAQIGRNLLNETKGSQLMPLIQKQKRKFLILGSAAFALCFTSVPLPAEHGRNFAGEFQVRNVVDEGSIIKFELHVKVVNFSGADLSNATLTLADRRPGHRPDTMDYQGSFTEVSIPYHKWIELDGSFMAPVREYQQWQRGAAPILVVTYFDETGKEHRDPVELRPALSGGLPKGEGQ